MFFKQSLLFFVVLLVFITTNAQDKQTSIFGKPSYQELSTTSYPKDPEASGVVLFEKGNYYFQLVENYNKTYVRLIKEVYRKIKVLNAKKFNELQLDEVKIYHYRRDNLNDKVKKIEAITHNDGVKSFVLPANIFDIQETEHWNVKKFTFPNIKDGSILEYKYTIETPYFFNLGDWEFQNDIPTLYSELNTEIPRNYTYKRRLIGKHPLYINDSSLKPTCFSFPGYTVAADCEVSTYAMKDLPAFKAEKYMLSKKNYMPRISYQLRDYISPMREKTRFSKRWKDVDKEFRYNKDLGRRLYHKPYFKNKLPESSLTISDPLKKTKAIFSFIQNHYAWNGNNGLFSEAEVKKSFENKSGDATEINLALINALQSADIDTKIVLLSTRYHEVPTTDFPTITDFNYVLAYVTIGEKTYILDASNKNNPFGLIAFKSLNQKGRVMDFKKGSYWISLEPYKKNIRYVNANVTIDDQGILTGNASQIHTGYFAVNQRDKILNTATKKYIHNKEQVFEGLEISEYSVENKTSIEEPLKEKYNISLETEVVGNNLHVYPFFLQNNFNTNPFKEERRKYPIEFGYPFSYTYLISIDIKNKYKVEHLPKNKAIKLPDNIGECTVIYNATEDKINLRFKFTLNEYYFESSSYEGLKNVFEQVTQIQTKEPIVLNRM